MNVLGAFLLCLSLFLIPFSWTLKLSDFFFVRFNICESSIDMGLQDSDGVDAPIKRPISWIIGRFRQAHARCLHILDCVGHLMGMDMDIVCRRRGEICRKRHPDTAFSCDRA